MPFIHTIPQLGRRQSGFDLPGCRDAFDNHQSRGVIDLERLSFIGYNNVRLTRLSPRMVNDLALTDPIVWGKMRAEEVSDRSLVYVAAISALTKASSGVV
jgi:hypothetical protein